MLKTMEVYYWDDQTEMFMVEGVNLVTGKTEGFCGVRIRDWEDLEMNYLRLENKYFRRIGQNGRLTLLERVE